MNLAQEEAEDAENESKKKKILHALGYFAERAVEFRGSTAPNLLPAGRRSH